MGKRIMLAVVGAAIGSLAGLVVSQFGPGRVAVIIGALFGATVPLIALGRPGR